METTGLPADPVGDSEDSPDAMVRFSDAAQLARLGRGGGEKVLQPVRPDRGFVDLDVPDATNTRLDLLDVLADRLLGHPDLDPEHQLFPLTLRLDLLGSELRFRRDETDVCGHRSLGVVVESDPPLGPDLHARRLFRGRS